jgi:hypothetical protein
VDAYQVGGRVTLTDQQLADYRDLLERPQFQRFLLRVIQLAGIYEATANGSEERTFYTNGRRSLGLDILREVDAAQPLPSPTSIPTLTLIQVHREDAQSQTPERTKSGRRSDPYADIRTDADPGAE